jgi:hypothetical protein
MAASGAKILRQLEAGIDAIRFDPGDGSKIELPVKLRVHDSLFVPLAKWAKGARLRRAHAASRAKTWWARLSPLSRRQALPSLRPLCSLAFRFRLGLFRLGFFRLGFFRFCLFRCRSAP